MLGLRRTPLDRRSLRLWLALIFLAVAVPAGLLVHQAYDQLKWEAFHQQRALAEALADGIEERAAGWIRAEESRPFGDYAFLAAPGPGAPYVQRSVLSSLPPTSRIPGLIGHFQVDAEGRFTSPLVPAGDPAALGVRPAELAARRELAARIHDILGRNRLVRRAAASTTEQADAAVSEPSGEAAGNRAAEVAAALAVEQPAPQAAFDALQAAPSRRGREELGPVDELERESRNLAATGRPPPAGAAAARPAKRRADAAAPAGAPVVRTFEGELDPFELSLLASGHFVLYRKVWRGGQRFVQGAVLAQGPFLSGLAEGAFRASPLASAADLAVAYRDQRLTAFSGEHRYSPRAEELPGALLLRRPLGSPLEGLELVFSIRRLPAGPGERVLDWAAGALAAVLIGGFLLLYRLGARQLDLVAQQQDFVSAVSHELRTPLTSIRMYAEMLREGWASDEKRQAYYDYIVAESERLSRLIGNVLQLARMTRNDSAPELECVEAADLLEAVRAKVGSAVARAGFELEVELEAEARGKQVRVDPDLFSQIVINLVDNALKFSARSTVKRIELGCWAPRPGEIAVAVRDHGPGVARGQMKRIFDLFYRSGDELTRETGGTGIGLALVDQLARAMHGRIEVVNREPGAEFALVLPACAAAPASTRT